jgi:hypothetical protein
LNGVNPKIECNLENKFTYYEDSSVFLFDDTDVVVFLDISNINNDDVFCLMNLNDMVKETNEIGTFEIGNLKVQIKSLNDRSSELIHI